MTERSIVDLVLSQRFQTASGALALFLVLAGFGFARWALTGGSPDASLAGLFALGIGVALASISVTLGVMLLVSGQAENRRAAALSMGLAVIAFLLAAPTLLVAVMARTPGQ